MWCGLAVQSQQLLDEAQAIKSGLPSKLMHAEAELARASGLRLKHPAPGSILMGPRWLLVRAGPSAHARTQSVRRVQCMHAPAACTRQARRVSEAVGGVACKGQFVQARAELEREREEGAKLHEHIFQLERAEAKEASR